MKTFWKVLGAALAVGLTPYKVEKNEETGEKSYQALLWRITSAPGKDEKQLNIDINLEEGTLTSKLLNAVDPAQEHHLFSDELCVEYTGAPIAEEETPAAPAEPAAEPAAPAEPAEPAGPAAPETPNEKEEG